nr:D-alanyl-D-alanine carboxypeptidase family protein [Enterocloster lavalensis]
MKGICTLILAALLVLQPAAANVVWAREVRLEMGDEDGSRMKAVAAAAEAAGAQVQGGPDAAVSAPGQAAAVGTPGPDAGDAIMADTSGQEPGAAAMTGTPGPDAGDAVMADTSGQEPGDAVMAAAPAAAVEVQAPSALLMEASTGQVIYEKDADQKRSPASITKIMTLILIFDALESGKIKMTDEVVTSAYAKSMGGSQVFLEEGEKQTVETLIKCIIIASGNDASVTMAEYIGGTEQEFVRMMNERAAGLGMTNTHFVDCCGLTDSPDHVTTARDIAIMSRELINRYPQIHNYSTIWMENITHVTKQGTKEFGLSNTNKLLKMATNFTVTGLKTGSTSLAKYCLSATAEKDGVRLIAVVMAAPDFKARFADAQTMLNYGYANCRLYEDKEMLPLPQMAVTGGVADQVPLYYEGSFSYLSLSGEDLDQVEKNLVLEESLPAPVTKGQAAGVITYTLGGKKLGEVRVLAAADVEEAGYMDYLKKLAGAWLGTAGWLPQASD